MASGYDGPVVKRQRTSDGGRGYGDTMTDRHNPEVSPVVHVRGFPSHVTEDDVIAAVQHFGTVQFVIMLPRRNQALVEFSDVKGSTACVNFANSNQLCIGGQPAFFNYSTSKSIQRPDPSAQNVYAQGNKIVLFTVTNAKYPITVDVMHTICSTHGHVDKIVIFRKQFVQALVQFDNLESAKAAKDQLHGCDIYSGCCTLRAEYAKTDELNVRVNNSESWDYTAPPPAEPAPKKNAPLLADPRYHAQPTPYDYDEYGGEQGGYGGQGAAAQGYYDQGDAGYGSGYASPPGRGRGRGALGRGQAPGAYGGGDGRGYGQAGGLQSSGWAGGLQQTGGYADPSDAPPQGCVLMVYGLAPEQMNCDRIFNLFCLYGNVCRIKFLKTKEGSAMVQMGDNAAVERLMFNMNGVFVFNSKIIITLSKQPYLQVVNNPHELPDGSPSYKDFTTSKNNRFSTPEQANKNRIIHPTEILHFFNAPPKITEDEIRDVFTDAGVKVPSKILLFHGKARSERSSTGLLEWESKQDAMEAMAVVNHTAVPNSEGGRPFYIKLCFSPSNIREKEA